LEAKKNPPAAWIFPPAAWKKKSTYSVEQGKYNIKKLKNLSPKGLSLTKPMPGYVPAGHDRHNQKVICRRFMDRLSEPELYY